MRPSVREWVVLLQGGRTFSQCLRESSLTLQLVLCECVRACVRASPPACAVGTPPKHCCFVYLFVRITTPNDLPSRDLHRTRVLLWWHESRDWIHFTGELIPQIFPEFHIFFIGKPWYHTPVERSSITANVLPSQKMSSHSPSPNWARARPSLSVNPLGLSARASRR